MRNTTELKFRLAIEQDYDAVVALMGQLNPDDPRLAETHGKEVFTRILRTHGLYIYLIEDSGAPVATCYLNVVPNLTRAGRSYALIENVVTDHNHRRSGVGTMLLEQVVDIAFNLDCYKVMLLSGRGSDVHTFYERCGFEKNSKTAFIKRAAAVE